MVLAEHFPSRVQPWLLIELEEILLRGGRVTVVASRSQGRSFAEKVHRLGLVEATRYYPLESLSDLIRCLRRYVMPLEFVGAYRGLLRLLRARDWHPTGVKQTLKTIARAPLLAEPFALIHSHFLTGSAEFLPIALAASAPLVTSFEGLPPPGVAKLSPEKAAEVFALGTLFLVRSRFARRQLESLGCDPTKIRVFPAGLRMSEFPFTPREHPYAEPLVLLTVSRLTPEKGHVYALQAVRQLVDRGMSVEYRIAGKGPESEALRKVADDLELGDHVRLLGELDDQSLLAQYSQAHIFILPSLTDKIGFHEETQGAVIQEAQASGCIVVATKAGGIPEFVDDGKSAFLVPDRDASALAEAVLFVATRPQLWRQWQDAARRWVEEHLDMTKVGPRLLALYEEAIALHGNTNAKTPHGD